MLYNSKAQTLNKAGPSVPARCLIGLLKVEQTTDLVCIHNSHSLGNSIQCGCFAIFCMVFLKIRVSKPLAIIMSQNHSQCRDI